MVNVSHDVGAAPPPGRRHAAASPERDTRISLGKVTLTELMRPCSLRLSARHLPLCEPRSVHEMTTIGLLV